eukprot:m.51983 g.51983  ORF g.51983 m.51983 type:complete len:806 (+) comp10766_c0_seq3:135-2552(+)
MKKKTELQKHVAPFTGKDVSPLARLPAELLCLVAKSLDLRDVLRMTQVSHSWREILLSNEEVWKEIRVPIFAATSLSDADLDLLLRRAKYSPELLDIRGCSNLKGTCLRSLSGCNTLRHLDIRGTRLQGNVPVFLNSLSPVRGDFARISFQNVETRLVAQAAWHGVVRSEEEWNTLVECMGQHCSSTCVAATGNQRGSIVVPPPINFATHMLLVVSIAGLINDNFWPKPLHRVKSVLDFGSSLGVHVNLLRKENAGWMDIIKVPQCTKPVKWFFDQQDDWIDNVHSFTLSDSEHVGIRKDRKSLECRLVDEPQPAKMVDLFLRLLVENCAAIKFGRSIRHLSRQLEEGRTSIEELIKCYPIQLPSRVVNELIREVAFRQLPKPKPTSVPGNESSQRNLVATGLKSSPVLSSTKAGPRVRFRSTASSVGVDCPSSVSETHGKSHKRKRLEDCAGEEDLAQNPLETAHRLIREAERVLAAEKVWFENEEELLFKVLPGMQSPLFLHEKPVISSLPDLTRYLHASLDNAMKNHANVQDLLAFAGKFLFEICAVCSEQSFEEDSDELESTTLVKQKLQSKRTKTEDCNSDSDTTENSSVSEDSVTIDSADEMVFLPSNRPPAVGHTAAQPNMALIKPEASNTNQPPSFSTPTNGSTMSPPVRSVSLSFDSTRQLSTVPHYPGASHLYKGNTRSPLVRKRQVATRCSPSCYNGQKRICLHKQRHPNNPVKCGRPGCGCSRWSEPCRRTHSNSAAQQYYAPQQAVRIPKCCKVKFPNSVLKNMGQRTYLYHFSNTPTSTVIIIGAEDRCCR